MDQTANIKKNLPVIIITALFLLTNCLSSSGQTSFDNFKSQYQDDFSQFSQTFESGVAESQQEYEAYQQAIQEEFDAFKKEMEQRWGSFDERTKKQWVEYKETGNIKYKVDFETGEGTVEILTENEEETENTKADMKEHLADALNDKGSAMGIPSDKIPSRQVSEDPILENQVDKEPEESTEEYAERVAENRTKTRKVTGKDGKERTVVYLNFNLAPDHIRTRAQKISAFVYTFSEQYHLDPALVFAIIHTESYFNPTAASHANAFGLMQLVPESGGRDAYKAVFDKDGIPTRKFLFNPENNVNLGCAYVDLLMNNYLKKVEDPLSRQYLAIAAYNTGPGNVARAYTGNQRVSSAMGSVNQKTASENYEYLVANLPYQETRDYLKRVIERSAMYDDMKR